jgi:hypothetical protein
VTCVACKQIVPVPEICEQLGGQALCRPRALMLLLLLLTVPNITL